MKYKIGFLIFFVYLFSSCNNTPFPRENPTFNLNNNQNTIQASGTQSAGPFFESEDTNSIEECYLIEGNSENEGGDGLCITPDWKIEKIGEKDLISTKTQTIGYLGLQDKTQFVGYSNGYLLFPPYKLAVDSTSFSFLAQREDLKKTTKEFCKNFWSSAENAGKQYTQYLGSDKNWIYSVAGSFFIKDKQYWRVSRVKKESDFKILPIKEVKTILVENNDWLLEKADSFRGKKEFEELIDGFGCGLRVAYQTGYIYLSYLDEN